MRPQLGAYSPYWVEQHGSHMASTTVRNDSGLGFTLNYMLELRRTKKRFLGNLRDFFAVTYPMNIQGPPPLRISLIGPEEAMGSVPGGTEHSLVVYSSSRANWIPVRIQGNVNKEYRAVQNLEWDIKHEEAETKAKGVAAKIPRLLPEKVP
jgi:hypothetical protein